MASEAMNAIAAQFVSDNVGSIFLYTNEAHPGEHYPHHTSMDIKFKHAEALRNVLGVTRPILVDGLDGKVHWAYGSMPNMTWIFTKSGVPIYKSDWSDANSVQNAIEYYLQVNERRKKDKERLAPFHVERLDYRNVDRDAFYEGLERNGPKAVTEFRDAFS